MKNLENKTSLGFLDTTRYGQVEVFQDGNKYYYFSKRQFRLFPLAKKYIKF